MTATDQHKDIWGTEYALMTWWMYLATKEDRVAYYEDDDLRTALHESAEATAALIRFGI